MEAHVRLLCPQDAPDAAALEAISHPGNLHEGEDFFARMLARWSPFCPGAFFHGADDSPALGAYLLGHPAPRATLTALATVPDDVPPDALWFIHDLAVGPEHRGSGLGARLLALAAQEALARNLAQCRIVAVNRSESWWTRLGFRELQAEAHTFHREALSSYGGGTVMEAPTALVLEKLMKREKP